MKEFYLKYKTTILFVLGFLGAGGVWEVFIKIDNAITESVGKRVEKYLENKGSGFGSQLSKELHISREELPDYISTRVLEVDGVLTRLNAVEEHIAGEDRIEIVPFINSRGVEMITWWDGESYRLIDHQDGKYFVDKEGLTHWGSHK